MKDHDKIEARIPVAPCVKQREKREKATRSRRYEAETCMEIKMRKLSRERIKAQVCNGAESTSVSKL